MQQKMQWKYTKNSYLKALRGKLMRAERVDNTNFQGKLIIVNRLSNKPGKCINKVKSDIENLITKKDYNLYITQDYSKNEINIKADYPFPYKPDNKIILLANAEESFPINSKTSKYIDTAKKTIEKLETNISKQKELLWEKEQNKQERKELLSFLAFNLTLPFIVIAEGAKEGFKDLKTTFNKLAKKFATKKG